MKPLTSIMTLAFGLSFAGFSTAQESSEAKHDGHQGARFRKNILKKFDADSDGKLNDAERATAKEQFKKNHPELFAKADNNGDGKLSQEEFQAARAAIRKHILEKFDADNDGKLNDQERKAAREAAKERFGKNQTAE